MNVNNQANSHTQQSSLIETQTAPIYQPVEDLFPEIIGRSPAISKTLDMVAKIANAESSVLILGESGTGKELIASAIHRLSRRRDHSFVAINCSAIPEELLEAELFGHEKGAFTGADKTRQGHFGAAEGGTIFLDEVGDMPLRLQAKLLRVLQERQYTPIGSSITRKLDIRFIAATNKDLEEAVKAKRFRLDLYHRLYVLPVHLPPLIERREDIRPLAEHFLRQMNRVHAYRGEPCWINESALAVLESHPWPGNIRQLRNLMERLSVVKGGGCIEVGDLPPEYQRRGFVAPGQSEAHTQAYAKEEPSNQDQATQPFDQKVDRTELPAEGMDLNQYLRGLEDQLISQALSRTNNNKNQAAKLLGLNRTTLVERIKKREKQKASSAQTKS